MKHANPTLPRPERSLSRFTPSLPPSGVLPRSSWSMSCLLLASLLVCLGAASAGAQNGPASAPAQTDVTFTFTADVHVSFDAYDDHEGIEDSVTNQGGDFYNLLLIKNETAQSAFSPSSHHDGCLGEYFAMDKDLCNQIQLVRKLNHLPMNSWDSAPFTDFKGHKSKLVSGGLGFGTPSGLIIAGDLTDCGGGSPNISVFVGPYPWDWDAEDCDINYGNGVPGAQLAIFKQLFDRQANFRYMSLNSIPVISGLNNPDGDVPLQYPIYPHLGNHDLGFANSDTLQQYVSQWSPDAPISESRHVTNRDPNSSAYSWDWGRLHIVNVGVFAGSSNSTSATTSNYAYAQEAMDWLQNDLQTFAGDGRPVILCQHFGFDPYSYSANWYLDSAAQRGAQNIWAVLAPYNVIGIFHGHHHEQNFYSFRPNDFYINGVLEANAVPRMAYDVFEPGPGFGQDFAAIRVTDNFIDVEATAWNSDFVDGQNTVQFVPTDSSNPLFFTKRLVQPPSPAGLTQIDSNEAIAASVNEDGSQYAVLSNTAGRYTARRIYNDGASSIASTGSFAVVPRFLTSYTQQKNGYILVSDGSTIIDYLVMPGGVLQKLWSDSVPLQGMAVVYGDDQAPHLAVDQPGSSGEINLSFFQLTNTEMTLESTISAAGQYSSFSKLVPFAQPNGGGFFLLRYIPNGNVNLYKGSVDASGTISLSSAGSETWMADSVYQVSAMQRSNVLIQPVVLSDASVGILVKSPGCLLYDDVGACATTNAQDSPYSVRTLTQDETGTEVAWRGSLPGLPFTTEAVAALPLQSATSTPTVGLYSASGLLTRITINGNFQ